MPEPVLALLIFVMGVWLWDNHFGEEQGYEEGACRMALVKIDRDLRIAEGMKKLPAMVRIALLVDGREHPLDDRRAGVMVGVGRLPGLEVDVGILGGAPDARVLRRERPPPRISHTK